MTYFDGEDPAAHPQIATLLAPFVGQSCWRIAVRKNRSLSVGFGAAYQHNGRTYGSWEVGNYYGAWRVIRGGSILAGSGDPMDDPADLERPLSVLKDACFEKLFRSGPYDVTVCLTSALTLQFLGAIRDDDETFHLFAPNDMYLGYSIRRAWEFGPSNKPSGDR